MTEVKGRIDEAFREAMADFGRSTAMRMLAEGRINIAHYKAILREMYHYAKEDPQIQALATVYFRGADRSSVKMFLKHAVSEVGHDEMALNDLQSLGVEVSRIRFTMPLPSTIALTAYPFYQTQFHNPIGYLGYLYFLEHMPTLAGAGYMGALQQAGIPRSAMTFLAEHVSVDIAHNRLMEEYIGRLLRSPSDLSAVCYAIRTTGYLYGAMLAGAIDAVERPPRDEINFEESCRSLGWTDSLGFMGSMAKLD